jgi:hypothetical protein
VAVAVAHNGRILDLQIEGRAVIGTTTGTLGAADALRNDAKALSLKLLPYNGGLTGRLLAGASTPGMLATIPFTVTLQRSQADLPNQP